MTRRVLRDALTMTWDNFGKNIFKGVRKRVTRSYFRETITIRLSYNRQFEIACEFFDKVPLLSNLNA